MTNKLTKYIFVTGGVVSSVGKGICASVIATLLQASGFSIKLRKLDPYLNVDPGTMNPSQHGEVYVTEDGAETDLDLGHYERFTGVTTTSKDSVSSGQIYLSVIERERRGEFLGSTIQVIPHITDTIKDFIVDHDDNIDFVICEIGGTVGDIEGLPFLEAIRQVRNELGTKRTLFVHLTLVPYLKASDELKTKPTQHSVKELQSFGISPDLIVCRSENMIPDEALRKISLHCNVNKRCVITAVDSSSIYNIPIAYYEQEVDKRIYEHFQITPKKKTDLSKWNSIDNAIKYASKEVKIAIVGKYVNYKDSYKSITEALVHAGIANNVKVKIEWIDADVDVDAARFCDGILIPGGFGNRGIDGKIKAVQIARKNDIPFFGICLGMQLAVIDIARLAGIQDAGSTEFHEKCQSVVGLMTEWIKDGQAEFRTIDDNLGGTMRLGSYPCVLGENTLIRNIYNEELIHERHRHRYEVNPKFCKELEAAGLIFSGLSPDGILPEAVELTNHPWFIGVQFHPELKSKPFDPHPLFVSFVKAATSSGRAER